ncbi:aldo/keto reductase [bacterium]|nr:aldo/keto reductase [bacterium]
MSTEKTLELNNGVKIPKIGFGTNVLRGAKGVEAIQTALAAGCRLIDTAQSYHNEDVIGRAVAESDVPREDVFITTKIDDENQGTDATVESLEISLRKLQTDYVDLLLVHWPYPGDFGRSLETWRTLIELQAAGKARAIGVSNYTIDLIQKTIDDSGVVPAVNQVEFHPFLFQKDLMDYCQQKGVLIESYCPIARAERSDNPVLQKLAKKYGKSPVQIILRWQLEHQLVPIPRSMNPEHIKGNMAIYDFALTDEEVRAMDSLNEDYRIINPDKGPAGW